MRFSHQRQETFFYFNTKLIQTAYTYFAFYLFSSLFQFVLFSACKAFVPLRFAKHMLHNIYFYHDASTCGNILQSDEIRSPGPLTSVLYYNRVGLSDSIAGLDFTMLTGMRVAVICATYHHTTMVRAFDSCSSFQVCNIGFKWDHIIFIYNYYKKWTYLPLIFVFPCTSQL